MFALVMFLFSYHVHEKQILIPLLPIAFLNSQDPFFVYFFHSLVIIQSFPVDAQRWLANRFTLP